MEMCRQRNLSLVRLKRDSKKEYSEQYSVFAGNSKLSKKLGIDVTKVEFTPGNKIMQNNEIDSSYSSDTRTAPYKQKLISNEEHISDTKTSAAKIVLGNGSTTPFNQAMTCMESTKTSMPKSHFGGEKSEDAMSGKLSKRSALFRSCKPCKSVQNSSRTQRIEKEQEIFKKKTEETSSPSTSLTTSTNIELECKIKILSYVDYLTFMKCQMGLKGGLVIEREEAFAKEVIANNGNSYRIYFVRTSFADKDILRSPLFEKTIGKKASKYRCQLAFSQHAS